jgi:glucan endo-1,3-alpha-glucosidase
MGNYEIGFQSDRQHIEMDNGGTYMAAVSPWFFTVRRYNCLPLLPILLSRLQHYGPDSWDKNWIYRGDDWLYNKRWEMLVESREYIDIVQILSWNGTCRLGCRK